MFFVLADGPTHAGRARYSVVVIDVRLWLDAAPLHRTNEAAPIGAANEGGTTGSLRLSSFYEVLSSIF